MKRSLILGVSVLAILGCGKKGDDDKASGSASAIASATPKSAPSGTGAAAGSASGSAKPEKVEVPWADQVSASKPLDIKTTEQTLDGAKITAEVCSIEGGPYVGKSNMKLFQSVRAVGDRVFVVDAEGRVRAFKIEAGAACKLTIDKTFGTDGIAKLENEMSRLTADSSGNLWATSGVFNSYRLAKDGKVSAKCEARPQGYIHVHPSGKTAIGTFANATVAKVTLDATGCKSEPFAQFTDLGSDEKRKGPITNAQAVGYVGETIFMGGVLAKTADPNGGTVVLALDATGKEKFRMGKTDKDLASKDRFGWVHAIQPCNKGVCIVDSNYRRLTAWKPADGKFVGEVDLQKLFGLKYPWIPDFDRNKTHTYFVTGQDRESSKVAEATIYRVTGL